MDAKTATRSHGDLNTEDVLLSSAQGEGTAENSKIIGLEAGNKLPDQRANQVEAMALRGPKKPKSKDSWLNTVGKYPKDAPLNHVLDEGAKIREAERLDPCKGLKLCADAAPEHSRVA